ncbi:hypothetical protein KM043_014767 [Ampulex compressa]|nr:hypothetical protein KM043_014767 [Ampulex compressa]
MEEGKDMARLKTGLALVTVPKKRSGRLCRDTSRSMSDPVPTFHCTDSLKGEATCGSDNETTDKIKAKHRKKMSTPENRALKCISILYIFCNAVLALIGKALLAVAVLGELGIIKDLNILYQYDNLSFEMVFGSSIAIIITSSIGVISGSMKLSKGIITNASLSLTFVLSALGYAVNVAVTADYTPNGELYRKLRRRFVDYDNSKEPVNDLQSTLSCCGIDSFLDWRFIWNKTISRSCCLNGVDCLSTSPFVQPNSCFEALKILIAYYGAAASMILGFIIIIAVISAVLSYPLYRSIKEMEENKLRKLR